MPVTPPSPEVVTLRLPSRLELLSLLDSLTKALCERLRFDEDAASQVTLSVIEAGTNAIQHGQRREAATFVDFTFSTYPDRLEVDVHDNGPGFDLEQVDGDVTSPDRLLQARGRGIFIMRACMDSVDFAFDPSGTTCRLVKRRAPSAANPG